MSQKPVTHTPEPWTAMPTPPAAYDDHGWRSLAMCGSSWMVAAPASVVLQIEGGIVAGKRWDSEANARRIVACVNFCAGLSTEIIENSRCGEHQQVLLKERDTYRELCVELTNAMRNLEISANSADYCYARNGGNFAHALAKLKVDAENARELFTKAEKILGGSNK